MPATWTAARAPPWPSAASRSSALGVRARPKGGRGLRRRQFRRRRCSVLPGDGATLLCAFGARGSAQRAAPSSKGDWGSHVSGENLPDSMSLGRVGPIGSFPRRDLWHPASRRGFLGPSSGFRDIVSLFPFQRFPGQQAPGSPNAVSSVEIPARILLVNCSRLQLLKDLPDSCDWGSQASRTTGEDVSPGSCPAAARTAVRPPPDAPCG